MSKRGRSVLSVVLSLALMIGTAPVAQARTNEDLYSYYDPTWTYVWGDRFFYCDDTTDWWGTISSTRIWTHTNCETGQGWTKCQIYHGGVWYDVTCPF